MLWRHRIVIGSVAALFMMLTGLYVASRKPLYASEGVTDDYDSRPRGGVDPGDIAIIRSEMGVLQSRTLLRDVASTLHLDADPEFNPLLLPRDNSLLSWLDPRPFLHRLITPSRGSSTPAKKRREQYQAVIFWLANGFDGSRNADCNRPASAGRIIIVTDRCVSGAQPLTPSLMVGGRHHGLPGSRAA